MNLLESTTQQLSKAGIESARLDALILIEFVSSKSREWLLAHPDFELSKTARDKLDDLLTQRQQRIPLAYLLGKRDFYSLRFNVDDSVLIPRPETEVMVEYAIKNIPQNASVLEVGTGSGCISIALAANRPDIKILATDISTKALKTARANNRLHKTSVTFIKSDLFKQVAGTYDVILANLPYVPVGARRQAELHYEPDVALYGGADGLDYYRTYLNQLPKLLSKKGFSLVECSPTQYAALRKLCKESNLSIKPISEYIYKLSVV